MVFQKMPRSAIQHLYLGRLLASDRRTDGRTDGRRANFLERYVFDNHPFGVDNHLISALFVGSFELRQVAFFTFSV